MSDESPLLPAHESLDLPGVTLDDVEVSDICQGGQAALDRNKFDSIAHNTLDIRERTAARSAADKLSLAARQACSFACTMGRISPEGCTKDEIIKQQREHAQADYNARIGNNYPITSR